MTMRTMDRRHDYKPMHLYLCQVRHPLNRNRNLNNNDSNENRHPNPKRRTLPPGHMRILTTAITSA